MQDTTANPGTPGDRDPVRAEYTRAAAGYDRRWRGYVDRSTRETLARTPVAASDRVLDIGCGTGVLLAGLASQLAPTQLVGVDLTPAMLAVARGRLPPATLLPAARAEALPFAAGSFDVVVSCSVFHFVPRPDAALGEMHRVLRHGGRLVLTDWCHDYLACRLLDRWLRLARRPHHRIHRAAELRQRLGAAGFAGARADRFRIGYWGMMTLTAHKPEPAAVGCAGQPIRPSTGNTSSSQ